MSPRNKQLTAELYLLLVTFLWGWSFPVMKLGLEHLSTFLFLTYRFLLATLIILLLYRGKVFDRRYFLPGIFLGFIMYISQGLQTYGLNFTTASNSAFITVLSVIFAPLLAYVLMRERLRGSYFITLSLALLGVYLLTSPSKLYNFNYGDFLTLLCAVGFGFYIVYLQIYTHNVNDISSLLYWQTATAAFLYGITTLFVENYQMNIHPLSLVAILYTGILTTFLTLILQFKYQRYTTVQRASIIYAAEPLFAHITAILLLGEYLTLLRYIGAFLIMISLLLQETIFHK